MVLQAHHISKKISLIIVIAFIFNITAPLYSQTFLEQAQAGLSKAASAVGKAFQELAPSKIKELASSASSKLMSTLSEKINQLKDQAPNVILPKLLENVDKLGQQVGRVASCMATGNYTDQEKCSSQDRAALIAVATTVVALTAVLLGFTIGIAATSKEVDSTMENVSKQAQVEGWSPQAVFARLQNTASQFKQNIASMDTCLRKRQCTKTQKNILWGTAITIMVFATIAVGIGIGSYLYSREKAKKAEQSGQEAQAVPVQKATGPLLGAMGAFTDVLPAWKTKFMQQVSKIIQPVQGAGATLKSAYETIQQEIKKGAVTTAKQATELFEKMVLKAKSIDDLIRETLDVNLANALEQFNTLKNKFVTFKNTLPELWSKDMVTLRNQLQDLVNYGKQTADRIDEARDAWKKLNIGRIAQAKFTSAQEFANKKVEVALEQEQLSKEKFALQEEIDAFYAAQQEAEPSGTTALKPSLGQKIKQKIGKKPQDTSSQIRQQMADFERRQKQLEQKEEKLQEKLTLINRQIAFDQFVNKKNLDEIYKTFVAMINGLKLAYLDNVLVDLLGKTLVDIIVTPSSLPASGKIGIVVTLGLTAANNNIRGGLLHITDGISRFIKYAREATHVQPLITAPKMDTKQLAEALLETSANIELIKEGASKIPAILKLKQPILDEVNAIEKAINNLESAIKSFKPTVIQKFMDTISAAPLTSIPKAPAILLASLAEGIRTLKIALINTINHSAQLLQLSIQVVPDTFYIVNKFNDFFREATGAPFINPQFMQAISNIQTSSLPEINEGMKILVNSLQADMPDTQEITIPGL